MFSTKNMYSVQNEQSIDMSVKLLSLDRTL